MPAAAPRQRGMKSPRRLRLWGRPPGRDVRRRILEAVDSIAGCGGLFSKESAASVRGRDLVRVVDYHHIQSGRPSSLQLQPQLLFERRKNARTAAWIARGVCDRRFVADAHYGRGPESKFKREVEFSRQAGLIDHAGDRSEE